MRIVFGVQYLGTNYSGWQKQPNQSTIQQALENAFSNIANENIHIVGAGRTDTGVHASGQVGHFDTNAVRDNNTWVRGVNRFLPEDISVNFVSCIDDSFHARFSAVRRQYRYLIYNNNIPSSCWGKFAKQEFLPLCVSDMLKAAQLFVGKKDFTSIRDSECQSASPVREVYSTNIWRRGNFVIFEITANAFLHHMVRNILGILVPIGLGNRPINWAKDVLNAKDRSLGGVTYSPKGLYLHKINYDKVFSFQSYEQDHIIDMFD